MPEPVTLPDEAVQQVERLGSVDFVAAVASHNHAETIGGVVQSAWAGLARAFPGARTAIIHVDAGSRDGTAERALAVMPSGSLVQVQVAGVPASRLVEPSTYRADALRVIFALAERLAARGCAVVEADITSITPDWIGRLLAPVQAGRADFVAPYYVRHRFAGTLTTGVVYPWLRALYGRRLRYPVSGEFACSATLMRRYAPAQGRRSESARLSVDVEFTTQALASGAPLAQAFLGIKTQTASDATTDLSGTLSRVLGALFLEAERTAPMWQKVRGSQAVPVEGRGDAPSPESATVDRDRVLDAFRLGERNLQEIWAPVLPPLALLELRKVARLPAAEFRFPDALWARIVYDFALAYRMRVMNRDHLLSAFAPLYFGWLASFVGEVQAAPEPEVEVRIEQLCLRYEAEKPYLISRWRWPDRFSP